MIQEIFSQQNKRKLELRKSTAQQRIEKLKKLKDSIERHEKEIFMALQGDLRKSTFEAALTEIYFVYGEIDHAIKNTGRWMRPKSAKSVVSNLFAKNKIHYDPKGVCLIIAPWNYPFQLTLSPLVSAISAGNTSIIKPSEFSPNTSAIINKIVSTTFPKEEVCCFEGGIEVSEELLKLPFDHIFFTGSTAVGRIVMEAASKNLSGLTLELGGKSPVVVTASCNLKDASDKIAWGKLTNAGQTCIAPDYLLIDKRVEADFIKYFKESVHSRYFSNNQLDESVYGKIINEKHFKRLVSALDQAKEGGAKVESGGTYNQESLSFYPTLISNCPPNSTLLTEEIFGPILPIVTFENLDDAIQHINSLPKPLASYFFSDSYAEQERFLMETTSGGTCVNDVLIHLANPNLPFGGVGPSGMGSSHGEFGFKAFSHERTVVYQSKINLTKMIYPPYTRPWMLKIMKKLI